jgi:hypothetical protein
MSLEMITSFMQPNGQVPKSALTVVKKPNNDVEIILPGEDKAITASLEAVREVIVLRDRVASEGMSRDVIRQLQLVAPAAVPNGYGLEAFTQLPTNVMMKAGLESMAATVLDALNKLIKFLIEKLKVGFNLLIDSYKSLTGISPSAYKLAKQEVYADAMMKNWRTVMGTDLDECILTSLRSSSTDEVGAQLTIDGFFNDTTGICDNLIAFEPLISQLQRATEDLLVESGINMAAYNRIVSSNRQTATDEDMVKMTQRINNMLDTPNIQKISKLLEQLAKKVVESKLYKPDDKTGKAIVDRLRSERFRDILVGLHDACRQPRPLVLKSAEGFVEAKQQNFDLIVDRLKNFTPVDAKNAREFKQELDKLQVQQSLVAGDLSGFPQACADFLNQQNDVKAVVDVVREITANYAETVFKMTAFRNRVRQIKVVKMVANDAESQAFEANEEQMDKIRKFVKDWITRATSL